jgi:hypothetical protein
LIRESLFTDAVNTMTAGSRYKVFITVVNIFRLLRSMRQSFPNQTIELYREYERHGGVKVGVLQGFCITTNSMKDYFLFYFRV